MVINLLRFLTLGLFFFALNLFSLYAQESVQVIRAGRILDVENNRFINNVSIKVNGGVIQEITDTKNNGDNDRIIDLSKYTVLPGLIDAHTHLCDNTYMGAEFDVWNYPEATFGIVGTINAKKVLNAGFTTVRNVSEPFYADIALRDAIKKGWIDGPRMYVSGAMITMSGGHGNWGNWIAPQHKLTTSADVVADGPEEVRKATRIHIKYGVDLIKLAATGGFGTHGSIPSAASFTEAEMRAAVEEAAKHGLRVAAHAHGADGIKNAIKAGVTSIEHGTFLDDEAIEMMKTRNVYLVMDLLAAYYDLIEQDNDHSDKKLAHSNREEYEKMLVRFSKAYKAGVKIAYGTDSSIYPHGRNAEQFQLMADAGMKPIDAIRSATIVAAQLIGIEENAGSLRVGKWADLIAVEGNPLENLSTLTDVKFVMKAGKIYKWEREQQKAQAAQRSRPVRRTGPAAL